MVLEFMDDYHGIMTGFFPAVSKKEVTFSGNILFGHGPYVLSGNSTNLTISHRL